MRTRLIREQRDDIESLCVHIEGHLLNLRAHLGNAGSKEIVEKVRGQAVEIEGWAQAIKDVCDGKD